MKRSIQVLVVAVVAGLANDGADGVPDRPLRGVPSPHVTNALAMKFVWIPPGTFVMGSPGEEKGRRSNEAPHKVTITNGFYMGVHLVTQEQWTSVMGKNPSEFKGEANLPVEHVSWDDCQEFIRKLREKDTTMYRLPTETEWEYACRARTKSPYYCGNKLSLNRANFRDEVNGQGEEGRNKTSVVGTFEANGFGLHDMHGNLWQHCQDYYGEYPGCEVVGAGNGPERGEYRVLRGGSWSSQPERCRSAYREMLRPDDRGGNCGLRLCFSME